MQRKKLCAAAVLAVLLAGLILYLLPRPLSDLLGESSRIDTVRTYEFEIREGQPFIDSATYPELTEEQKARVFALCRQYSYRRTLGTPFSDGSISGLGNRLLDIFVTGGDAAPQSVTVSSTGKLAIANRVYKMDHAERFLEQMEEVLGEPPSA